MVAKVTEALTKLVEKIQPSETSQQKKDPYALGLSIKSSLSKSEGPLAYTATREGNCGGTLGSTCGSGCTNTPDCNVGGTLGNTCRC